MKELCKYFENIIINYHRKEGIRIWNKKPLYLKSGLFYVKICFLIILTGKLKILFDRITVTAIVAIEYAIKPNENELNILSKLIYGLKV